MKIKKVSAVIEASSTGFGIYVEDENLPLTSYGDTIEKAKEDLQAVLQEMLSYYKDNGQQIPKEYNDGNLEFEYKYDVASIFKYFGMLDATGLAKKIGMNPSLLRQYRGGQALASAKQKKRIEEGLHNLGRELLAVRL